MTMDAAGTGGGRVRIDRHSRLVGWLKVVLPLGALALLSSVFLVAERIDPSAAISHAPVDVESLVQDPRMTAPTYAGVTDDGVAIRMTARTARPARNDGMAEAEGVDARFETPGGQTIEATAARVTLDVAGGHLVLDGDVRVLTSDGYAMHAARLDARLDRSGLDGEGDVRADGPPGRITADTFTLAPVTRAGGVVDHRLIFAGNVRVLYDGAPRTGSEEAK